jgi:hypothetical protein
MAHPIPIELAADGKRARRRRSGQRRLAGNHTGAGRSVIRSGFVHLTRLRIDVSIVDQTLAAKVTPAANFPVELKSW